MEINQNIFLMLAYSLKATLRGALLDYKAVDIDFKTLFSFSFPLLITAATIFYLTTFGRQPIVKQYSLPPGPKPWPIIGCLPEMLKNKPAFRWIHNLMNEMNTEIACIRFANVHVIPVTCPKLAREFLKTQDAIFASRPISMSTSTTTKGYLTTILVPLGEQWKKMKKVLTTEVLSPAKHRWLHPKRLEEADHLVHYVYNKCGGFGKGGIVNVRTASRHYCGNVIRKLVFNRRFFGDGMNDGGPGYEEEEHVNALFTILEYTYSFCVSDYMPCLVGLDLDGHEKVVKEANGIIGKYHNPIIEERCAQWRHGKKKEVEDLLDVLITARDTDNNRLSVLEIEAQITELMIASVDNPSNAVEWALAEMINEPHILKKAIAELDKVVGKDRLVQESDCSQLNFIKACLREAFRLHPFTAFNPPHVSIADTTVSNYFIPKGSHVLLSRYGLGRNPKVWDEPLKFKPERHFKDDCSEVVLTESELRFISFSTGRRGCTGVNLGSTMTVMLFARLLQGFTWELPLGVSMIDLSEAKNSLELAKPLFALAKPRLPEHLYNQC